MLKLWRSDRKKSETALLTVYMDTKLGVLTVAPTCVSFSYAFSKRFNHLSWTRSQCNSSGCIAQNDYRKRTRFLFVVFSFRGAGVLLLSPSLLLVLFFLSSQKWIDAQRFFVSGGRNERHDGGYHLHQCEYCSKGLMPAKEDAGSSGSDNRVTEFARYSQSLKDPSILRETAAILCVTTKHQHRMLIATSLEQFFWQRFTRNKKGSLKCFAISAGNLNGSKSQSNPRRYEPIL